MNCPYCNDKLDYDHCPTCQECVVDLDHPFAYSDTEEFEQPDTLAQQAMYRHTDEAINERFNNG